MKKNNMLDGLHLGEVADQRDYVDDQVFTTQDIQDVKEYNANIKNIDPMYKGLNSVNYSLLVRAYKTEPEERDGVFVPPLRLVEIPTHAGHGKWTTVSDPWLFSQKAVAVSNLKTDAIDIKAGDEIIIGKAMIQITPSGSADEATLNLTNSFIHPESGLEGMPTDSTNPHHGYFLVPLSQLLFTCTTS
jgi:hypothetical protein